MGLGRKSGDSSGGKGKGEEGGLAAILAETVEQSRGGGATAEEVHRYRSRQSSRAGMIPPPVVRPKSTDTPTSTPAVPSRPNMPPSPLAPSASAARGTREGEDVGVGEVEGFMVSGGVEGSEGVFGASGSSSGGRGGGMWDLDELILDDSDVFSETSVVVEEAVVGLSDTSSGDSFHDSGSSASVNNSDGNGPSGRDGVDEVFVGEGSYGGSVVEEISPESSRSGKGLEILELLEYVVESGASDLHLSSEAPPIVRVDGDLEPVPGWRRLTGDDIKDAVYKLLESDQKEKFEEEKELDFAYTVSGGARFRGNLMVQSGDVGAVFRVIPQKILPLSALNLPATLGKLAYLPKGLVLVTGPTGSGKSTTLAAIIDQINRTRKDHILTIEDPVEFVHQHRSCVVNQREVGRDTKEYNIALKHALRQDPDVILIGEMRDLETISIALTAAETGHLVFATLHTQSAKDTISRVIDVFPAGQQQQIRSQLASTLQAVVCQTLLKRADGRGRIAATEIMMVNHAIENNIRQDKLHNIPSVLQTTEAEGNQTLNMHLVDLVIANQITREEAFKKTSDPEDLHSLLSGERAKGGKLTQNGEDEAVLKHLNL